MKVHGILEVVSGIIAIAFGAIFIIVGLIIKMSAGIILGVGVGAIIAGILVYKLGQTLLIDADRLNFLKIEYESLKNDANKLKTLESSIEKKYEQSKTSNDSTINTPRKIVYKTTQDYTFCKYCGAKISKSALYCPSCDKENQ